MFERGKSDALFTDTLDLLNTLNTRDGRFEYVDYVTLHNNITALYDSFSEVDELMELAKAKSDGRLMVLDNKLAISMCAGARAIERNINRMGKVYLYDVYKGKPSIAYLEAARTLREAAENALAEAKRAAEEAFAEAFCNFAESHANREFERQMREGWNGEI